MPLGIIKKNIARILIFGRCGMPASDLSERYVDGEAYEKFVGDWSRAIGQQFVEWIGACQGLNWLDVGCGTGALTSVILDKCVPEIVFGIDAMETQILGARKFVKGDQVHFDIGDAQELSFDTDTFDATVSGLVLNFVPDHKKMVAEMMRVTKPGGTVAAYVWDFEGGGESAQHLTKAISARDSTTRTQIAEIRNDNRTRLSSLSQLFEEAQLEAVEARAITIQISHQNFDLYWDTITAFASPPVAYANKLAPDDLERLKGEVQNLLPKSTNGSVQYDAWVSAVRGTVPI
jgi:ubiquinone/menaquinone biosynthesis C-methylase UbiE